MVLVLVGIREQPAAAPAPAVSVDPARS
jgi:hypothetical protein